MNKIPETIMAIVILLIFKISIEVGKFISEASYERTAINMIIIILSIYMARNFFSKGDKDE